jgi:hypothetical protein
MRPLVKLKRRLWCLKNKSGPIKVVRYCGEISGKNKPLGAMIARTIAPKDGNDLPLWKETHHESQQ